MAEINNALDPAVQNPPNETTEPQEIPPELEKDLVLKRKRSSENLLSDSPIKKVHIEPEEKKNLQIENEEHFQIEKENEAENEEQKEENVNEQEDPHPAEEEAQNPEEEPNNEDQEADNVENDPDLNDQNEQMPEKDDNIENEEKRRKSEFIKEVKKPVGKKIKDLNMVVADSASNYIIDEMNKAYEEDLKSIQKKQPALKKIKIFTEIEQSLRNYIIQSDFVSKDGLDIFEKWLKPQPDGTQPSLYLKKKILETLNLFPLDKDQFTKNDIGKVVNKICLSQTETPEIRRLAKTIIDKWTRLLTDNHINYGRYNIEDDDNEESSEKDKSQSLEKRKNNEIDILNSQKKELKYVLLPKKNNIEFYKNAKKNTETKKKNNNNNISEISDGTKEMYRILQNLRRNKNNM